MFMAVRMLMAVRTWLFGRQLLECMAVRMYNLTAIYDC